MIFPFYSDYNEIIIYERSHGMENESLSNLFDVQTELFIPIESHDRKYLKTLKSSTEWSEIDLYEKYQTYFSPAISSFLYKDTKWFHKQIDQDAELSFAGYSKNEHDTQLLEIKVEKAEIVLFPQQAYLLLRLHTKGNIHDITKFNSWITTIRSSQSNVYIRMKKTICTLFDYINLILNELHFNVSSHVGKVFGYSLLKTTDSSLVNVQLNTYLPALKDFFELDPSDSFIESEHSDVLQRFQSRLQTFSLSGGMVLVDENILFNQEFYGEYHHTIYRDIALLALYQMDFLNNLALRLSDVRNLIYHRKQILYLRMLFLEFTNKSWFSHISMRPYPQTLRDYWQKQLQIQKLYDDVTEQLDQLTNFAQQDRSWWLTIGLGTLTLLSWPGLFIKNSIFNTWFPDIPYLSTILAIFLPVAIIIGVTWDRFRGIAFSLRYSISEFFSNRQKYKKGSKKLKKYFNRNNIDL